ncbi:hypothetical protein [Bradyrhizobium ottawaense]|uniref:hypothetical protein n=1 Tax=Bradyrhizobium ottawaense TaxID=931866 RepID=UPI0027D6084D|nr:hypothetical protein BwSH14_43680 [Bradyrhizobium ottawaense]GMO87622.1 hypothetical protein BwSH17_72250 [Bradyrhizobium ottawaense]
MSQFFADVINQLDVTRPVQKQVGEIMRIQLGIKNGVKEKAAGASKSPRWEHLNDIGRKAAKRDEIASLVQSNAQSRVTLRKLRAEIKSSLPKLPGREKDDLAGVLQDQEYRAYVRGLPQEQRDRAQRLHPDIAAAVARAPAELSGVPESVHAELVNDMLRRTHGAELAKIAADVAAMEMADELIRAADEEIRAAAEVAHGTDFRVWAKPLVDPLLTDAGADFDELYRRQEPEALNVLGSLAVAAE